MVANRDIGALQHCTYTFSIGCQSTVLCLGINLGGVERLVLAHVLVLAPKSELGLRQTSFELVPVVVVARLYFRSIEVGLVGGAELIIVVAERKMSLPELNLLVFGLLLDSSLLIVHNLRACFANEVTLHSLTESLRHSM